MDPKETHQNKPVTWANALFQFFKVTDWKAKTQNKKIEKKTPLVSIKFYRNKAQNEVSYWTVYNSFNL